MCRKSQRLCPPHMPPTWSLSSCHSASCGPDDRKAEAARRPRRQLNTIDKLGAHRGHLLNCMIRRAWRPCIALCICCRQRNLPPLHRGRNALDAGPMRGTEAGKPTGLDDLSVECATYVADPPASPASDGQRDIGRRWIPRADCRNADTPELISWHHRLIVHCAPLEPRPALGHAPPETNGRHFFWLKSWSPCQTTYSAPSADSVQHDALYSSFRAASVAGPLPMHVFAFLSTGAPLLRSDTVSMKNMLDGYFYDFWPRSSAPVSCHLQERWM